jgi:subtilisin family serine protease
LILGLLCGTVPASALAGTAITWPTEEQSRQAVLDHLKSVEGFIDTTTADSRKTIDVTASDDVSALLSAGDIEALKAFKGNTVDVMISVPGGTLASYARQKGLNLGTAQAFDVALAKAQIDTIQDSILAVLGRMGVTISGVRRSTVLVNAITGTVGRDQLAKLIAAVGKGNVHIQQQYTFDLASSTVLIGATEVWAGEPGYDGTGMTVGVVDTGVDYNHPDLGGPGFPNSKVVAGYDFGDSDTDPMDTNGHGTHVSGTMVADGVVKGVAKKANLVIAKIVSGGEDSAWSDDIIAAFNYMADPNNVDGGPEGTHSPVTAVNMSFGSAAGFVDPLDPEMQAIENCISAGIVVSLSAGNSADYYSRYGTSQPWYPDYAMVGSPSLTPGSISVASVENTIATNYVLHESVTTGDYAYSAGSTSPAIHTALTGSYHYIYCGTGLDASYFPASVPANTIALIGRGTATFAAKINNAAAAGFVGAIIFNNAAGSLGMTTDGSTLPSIGITQADGATLKAQISGIVEASYKPSTWPSSTGTVTFPATPIEAANPSAGTVSSFSSWGAPPDLSFKPDLAAPGGNIWSTVPIAAGSYANYSGTSMASPHVAGAAALIRQAHPAWTVQQVKTALSNTAVLVQDPNSSDGDGGTLPYSPRLMGAGRINVANALATDVIVVQQGTNSPSVALGSVENWSSSPISFNLTLQNFGATPVTFNAGGTVQTTDISKIATSLGDHLTVSPAAVTVPAGGMRNVTVTVDLTSLASTPWQPFVEGYVTFHWDDVDELHVPYMGFLGNWNDFNYVDTEYNPLIDPPNPYLPGWSLSRALYASNPVLSKTGVSWPMHYGTGWALGQRYDGTYAGSAIAINPLGVRAPDIENNIWLLRNIERLTVDIVQSDGTTLVKRLDDAKWVWKNNNSQYFASNTPWYWDSGTGWWYWDGTDNMDDPVPDGPYILRNTATAQKVVNKLSYDAPQILDFPVFVDTVVPVVDITSVTPNGANQTVAWSTSDAAPSSGIWGHLIWWSMNGTTWLHAHLAPSASSYDVPRGALVKVDVYDNAQNYGFSTEVGDMTMSTTLPATVTIGAPAVEFTVTATNMGEAKQDVLFFGTLTTPVSWTPANIALEYYEPLDTSWHTETLTGSGGTLTFEFGPPTGFTFPAATTLTFLFRAAVAVGSAPGRVDLALDLMRLDAADLPVGTPVAELNATTYAITAPLDIIATPDPLLPGYTHSTYTGAVFTATGGIGAPYVFSATGVPAGLTLATNGSLAGTPTATGDYTLHVTVTNAGGALTRTENFPLHIAAGPGVTMSWEPSASGMVIGNPLPAEGTYEDYLVGAVEGWAIGTVYWNGSVLFARDPAGFLTAISTTFHLGPLSGANTLHAIFDPLVTVAVGEKGGSVTPGTRFVTYHSTPEFLVRPDPGYIIETLLVDGVVVKAASNSVGYTVTFPSIDAPHAIHATFRTIPDFLPPTITLPKFASFAGVTGWIDGPVQTFYVRTSPFPLQFTLEDNSGSVKWTIKVNGTVVIDPIGIGLINYSLALTEGRNDVQITGVDGAGNWTTQRLIIYLDSMAPALSVNTLPSSLSAATLPIAGSAIDAVSGLASLSINGERVIPFLDGSFSEKLALVKGVNTVLVEAKDKAGNITSQTFTVTYATASSAPSSLYVVLTIGSTDMEVNGLTRKLDAAPFIKDGRTLLPIRALIEALGGSVQWNASTRTATVMLGSRTVALTIGSTTALVNGKAITLDVAPMIVGSRTFLPLRAVAENLGLDLAWEPISRTISLTYWP